MSSRSAPTTSPATRDLGISIGDLYRLSVAQFHAIADAAILDEDTPVELLEGWLVCKYGPFEGPARIPAPLDPTTPEEAKAGLTLASIWRFTTEQYHALIDADILTEDDPVELLGGWLIQKMSQKPTHPIAVDIARDAFLGLLAQSWYVRTQAPITLPDGEPEPDIALARGKRQDYRQRHPRTDDIALVLEVADTSLARDRGVKKQMYALARIPVYWIVNLIDGQIEVYTDPTGPADEPDYRERLVYRPEDEIPVVLDGAEVGRLAAREILP
jgi:Uma2 family endonuclease